MTVTTDKLRTQLTALQLEHDTILAELTPKASPGPDGRMVWRDVDLAEWMRCALDTVRGWIVEHVTDFRVTDDCRCAVVGGRQFAALTLANLQAPRLTDLDFVGAQITLIASRLKQLDGDASV